MEDLEAAPGSPALQDGEEPQGNNDPGDTLGPGYEEESRPNAPVGDPTADIDTFGDDEAPQTVAAMEAAEDEDGDFGASDNESELEELSEKEFEDFDPAALNIPDKPVQVDESNVALLGVHKRKRTDEEERERKKKKKEKKRDKPKRQKRVRAGEDGEGDEVGLRGSKLGPDGRPKKPRRAKTPDTDDETLTPEERRRRALDRKMDEALKSFRPTRRRAGIDLESLADQEIETMRQRMAKACELDAEARARGDVATHKLKILPEVVELMNRNTIQAQLVDPDINLLEAVRFMLEPADHDAALPNYQIQRDLFSILGKLNIGKEALIASGIGKVVLFYTKSIQPQQEIKRQAERLLGEWMRVVLKKDKNMRNLQFERKVYDPLANPNPAGSQPNRAAMAAEKRKKALAIPVAGNRARVEGGVGTYTIAPVNNRPYAEGPRRAAVGGEMNFRRITTNSAARQSGRQ